MCHWVESKLWIFMLKFYRSQKGRECLNLRGAIFAGNTVFTLVKRVYNIKLFYLLLQDSLLSMVRGTKCTDNKCDTLSDLKRHFLVVNLLKCLLWTYLVNCHFIIMSFVSYVKYIAISDCCFVRPVVRYIHVNGTRNIFLKYFRYC